MTARARLMYSFMNFCALRGSFRYFAGCGIMLAPMAMDGFRLQIYPKLAVLKFRPQLNALSMKRRSFMRHSLSATSAAMVFNGAFASTAPSPDAAEKPF